MEIANDKITKNCRSRGVSSSLPGLCAIAILTLWSIAACNRNDPDNLGKYPDYVGKIMRRNCSIKGCHNAVSKDAAGGLNLETWGDLFEGARGGSAVIPYSPEESFLLHSINTDTAQGPILKPTMPYGAAPLSETDYHDLREWIRTGATNHRGEERFPPRADRKKWYVANRGCDLVGVFDAETRQVMRYVHVGERTDRIDEPIQVVVSPDGNSWYAVFNLYHSYVERYSTLTDQLEARIDFGHNGWNYLDFSPDGHWAFLTAENLREVAVINTATNQSAGSPTLISDNVHGLSVHPLHPTVFMPMSLKSSLLLYDYDGSGTLMNRRTIDLVQNRPPAIIGELRPRFAYFLPDGSKYYVLCHASREIRILDGATDQLLSVIDIPASPDRAAYDPGSRRLFISSMDDSLSAGLPSGQLGSVTVIDCDQDFIVGTIFPGFQPHGLAVDAQNRLLVTANRNIATTGPQPHHSSACAGRNGFVTLFDLNTLQQIAGYRQECTVDPIAVSTN